MKIVWGRSLGFNIELNKMVRATQPIPGMEKFNPNTISHMQITQRIYDGAGCYNWREVFALWPVKTIGGKYVWLRRIYKRRFWVVWGTGFHMEPHVEYGTLFDMIEDDN